MLQINVADILCTVLFCLNAKVFHCASLNPNTINLLKEKLLNEIILSII